MVHTTRSPPRESCQACHTAPSGLRHGDVAGRPRSVAGLVVRRRWAARAAQDRGRAHRGPQRRLDQGAGREGAAPDPGGRGATRGRAQPAGDDGGGRRRALPPARAQGPQEVSPVDGRLRPAQPHRALLRRPHARPDHARRHRALHRGQAAHPGHQDDPQPHRHDALGLRGRPAQGAGSRPTRSSLPTAP